LARALDLVTLRTRPIFTHSTLPDCAQESATVLDGTCANELTALAFEAAAVEKLQQTTLVPFEELYIN
jgi:hypothetical protein